VEKDINLQKDKLIIFDCDGVLIDSEPMANQLFLQCLRREGFDVDDLYGEHFHGIALADCLRKVETDFGRNVPVHFVPQFTQLLDEEMNKNLKAMPGVHEALDQLPQTKCVASGSTHERLQLSLSVTNLLHYFPHIFSATDVAQGKPQPDLFLHAAAQLGFSPSNCIVIEDSYAGLQAALAAQMPVLLYNPLWTGKYPVPEGVPVFYDMKELPRLIQKMA
jgi:HAD superfamily hydrolase (TIGR01509 family)